jgi:hypothetical protein
MVANSSVQGVLAVRRIKRKPIPTATQSKSSRGWNQRLARIAFTKLNTLLTPLSDEYKIQKSNFKTTKINLNYFFEFLILNFE